MGLKTYPKTIPLPDVRVHAYAYIEIMTYTTPAAKPIRVLIADDFAEVRRELKTILSLSGSIFVAGESANGVEATRMAGILRPDAVLMDLDMPVMDGFQATAEIKHLLPACRVIAFTVYGGEVERQKAVEAGCDAYIVKGTPVESLISAIHDTNKNIEGGPG